MRGSFFYNPFKLMLGWFAIILLSGCIKSDLSHCEHKGELMVKATDKYGNDITDSGKSGDVLLFTFDGNGKFLTKQFIPVTDIKKKIRFLVSLDAGISHKYVAWGNVTDTLKMLDFSPARPFAQNKVKPVIDAQGYASIPADIFYGNKNVAPEDVSEDKPVIVEIKCAVSQIHVTIVGMKKNAKPRDYSIVIGNDNQSELSFENSVTRSAKVKYQKDAKWLQKGKMMGTQQAFRTLPSAPGTSKTVMLYKGDEVKASVAQDINGDPIAPRAGERVNILIDMNEGCDCPDDTGIVEAQVIISDWDEVVIWKIW